MARAAVPNEVPAAAPAAKKRSPLPILASAVVLLAAGGGGAYFFLAHRAASVEPHGEVAPAVKPAAQYLALSPAIVVNLDDADAMRYLQVDIEVMARDAAALEAAKLHMPRVRNTLMLLFSQQHFDEIIGHDGKQALQKRALEEVQAVLIEETGKPQIEALYFTNFVMQ